MHASPNGTTSNSTTIDSKDSPKPTKSTSSSLSPDQSTHQDSSSRTTHVNPLLKRLQKGTRNEDAFLPENENMSIDDNNKKLQSEGSSSNNKTKQQQENDILTKSPFQVQEYIAYVIRSNPHDIEQIITIPPGPGSSLKDTRENEQQNQEPQVSNENNDDIDEEFPTDAINSEEEHEQCDALFDKNTWIYEHLRRITMELSHPLVTSLQESCTRQTCPQMKCGEWVYLCAAHSNAQEVECCAIDYVVHTLDAATSLLNYSHIFPSRTNISPMASKHFSSITRRLYRIFTHAWFHHRDIFEQCEAETSLYERLLALIRKYNLIESQLLIIPSFDNSQSQDSFDDFSR